MEKKLHNFETLPEFLIIKDNYSITVDGKVLHWCELHEGIRFGKLFKGMCVSHTQDKHHEVMVARHNKRTKYKNKSEKAYPEPLVKKLSIA